MTRRSNARACAAGACIASVTFICTLPLACAPTPPAPPAPSDDPDGDPAPTAATYFEDIKPLIEEKCLACHVAGGIAPFALDVADDVVAMAPFLADTVESRVMPPWPPGPLSPTMRDDISLTDEQIALFRAWADAGAPLGDSAAAPPPPAPQGFAFEDVVPDVVATMTEEFVPTGIDTGEDEFRCFVVDVDIPAERMLVAQRFLPGNPLVDHHAILTLYARADLPALQALDDADDGAGWSCFGEDVPAEIATPVGRVGPWTPGNNGVVAYPGTGNRVPADVVVVMSMHYNVVNVIGADGVDLARAADRSSLELYFAPVAEADELIQVVGVGQNLNPLLRAGINPIPAGAADHTIEQTVVIADARPGLRTLLENAGIDTLYATGAGAHGHLLLKRFTIVVNEGDVGERVLLDIPAWDFNWQGQYIYVERIPLSIEDRVTVRCSYDNSADNRARVGLDPTPVEVTAGEGTGDEMCIGGLAVVLQDPG